MGKSKKASAPKIESFSPADLREHPANPKQHPATQVAEIRASLRRYGQQRLPVVLKNRTVIAGWGTVLAAREEGMPGLWCVVTDLEGANREGYLLADNATADLGTYDEAAISILIAAQEMAADGSTEGLGYTDEQLQAFRGAARGNISEGAAGDDLDDVGELSDVPVVEKGDVWAVGEHLVFCGDSLDTAAMRQFLGRKRVDLVVTDPPYAIYGSSTGVSSSVSDDRMVQPFFRGVSRAIAATLKKFGHAYTFCDWRSWARVWEAGVAEGLSPANVLIWDKGDQGLGSHYMNCHEFVGYWQRLPEQTTMGQRESGQRLVHGRPNILRFPKTGRGEGFERDTEGGRARHNAAKPVNLLRSLMTASSDTGDLVLDLFLGSGSTLVAAAVEHRRGVGVEVEPANVQSSLERLERVTASTARRIRRRVGTEDATTEKDPTKAPTLEDLRT